ncbi:Cobalamin-5-phosphate synthase [Bartonella apihabitans]|uniref:Cobalamin-5-phosphate synthase n=2 Tax=Bartonella apihabitans TaxID=2750929 RepID=A0A1U9MBC3_9HYPH|nr:adenosylcobinamide-GDP ribazoletransferase [Bartonella apihabitans]AQT42810.1 Cobalamin-5-phosphate synthase [Bartonella apihabitans]
MIVSIVVLCLFVYVFSLECLKRIGGYTGDTLGAIEQCLAIILLATINLF